MKLDFGIIYALIWATVIVIISTQLNLTIREDIRSKVIIEQQKLPTPIEEPVKNRPPARRR